MLQYYNLFDNGTIICDDCKCEKEYEGTLEEVVSQAQHDGWRSQKDGKVTTHSCPACVKDTDSDFIPGMDCFADEVSDNAKDEGWEDDMNDARDSEFKWEL